MTERESGRPVRLLALAALIGAVLCCASGSTEAAEGETHQFEDSGGLATRIWKSRVEDGLGSEAGWAALVKAKASRSIGDYRLCVAQCAADGDALGEAVCAVDVVETGGGGWKSEDWRWVEQLQRRAAGIFAAEFGERSSPRALALANLGNLLSSGKTKGEARTAYDSSQPAGFGR